MATPRAPIADVGSAVTHAAALRESSAANHGTLREHRFNIDIYGSGIFDRLCTFNFAYTTQPSITVGWALQPGDVVIGDAPSVVAVPTNWARTDTGLYVAARVQITAYGHPRQRFAASITFGAVGLTLPGTSGGDSTTSNFDMDQPL